MKSLQRLIRWIRQLLMRWPMEFLGGLLLAMGVWMVLYTYQSSEAMVRQYATESAQTHADSVTQFRNFHTQELVPRAMKGGMEVTHDYKARDNALPLPATLTIDLGHYLSKFDGGTQVRLYSAQPFPWRVAEWSLDTFQMQALAHLEKPPTCLLCAKSCKTAAGCCGLHEPTACWPAAWLATTVTPVRPKPNEKSAMCGGLWRRCCRSRGGSWPVPGC